MIKKNKYNDLFYFSKKHAIWDPILFHDGEKWLLYVLTTHKKANQKNFFTRENYIHGFTSKDLLFWKDLGPIIVPRDKKERICAGSTIVENGIIYFFYSSTINQFSNDLLDQRIFLATSKDGKHFTRIENFNLPPEEKLYPTKSFNPETGDMMFAWRDPYIFKDEFFNKYYLFICAGGKRWGVSPKIAVAVAEQVTGPYHLLPPAVNLDNQNHGLPETPFQEIERVNVINYGGRYYMFFSCWKGNVSKRLKEKCYFKGYNITNSTIYVLTANQVTGPYTMTSELPIVFGSDKAGLYGIDIIPSSISHQSNQYMLVGWKPKKFTVDVTGNFKLSWKCNGVHVISFKIILRSIIQNIKNPKIITKIFN